MTAKDQSLELLPCPFCGVAARHLEWKAGFYSERVICDSCEFCVEQTREVSAITRWNRRTLPADHIADASKMVPAGMPEPVGNGIEWRPVLSYEDDYEVSNFGDLRNKKTGLIQAKNLIGAGYVKADLSLGGTRTQTSIHRLVAKAFLGEPKHAEQVNHINGVKTDNRVENLEWVSKSENETHSRYHLGNLCKPIIGRCLATGEEMEFASISIAADHVGVYRSAIGKCANGTLKTAKGWTFQFKKNPAAQVQAMLAQGLARLPPEKSMPDPDWKGDVDQATYKAGWNDCRTAMLEAAPRTIDAQDTASALLQEALTAYDNQAAWNPGAWIERVRTELNRQ